MQVLYSFFSMYCQAHDLQCAGFGHHDRRDNHCVIRNQFSRILPATLRVRLLIMALIVVSIPIISTGYVLEVKGRQALIEEKQTKLFGLAKLLDAHLGAGFDNLLRDYHGALDDRQAKIRFLNMRLRDYTDTIAEANPGVGVGYYSKSLNAIITYGPSREYDGKVGISIQPSHPGWKVMGNGERLVESGPLVRGHIMNAMLPITRNGEVIGYIWANEFTEAIERQALEMDKTIFWVMSFGLIVSLALSFSMADRVTRHVNAIKNGLRRMQTDLRSPIKPLRGEMGEIVAAVNDMAQALVNERSLNENILMSIADGVITVDTDGQVTSINPAAQQMMGMTASDTVGRPYASLFSDEVDFTSLLLDTLQSGKEHISVTLDYPLKDRVLYISSSTSLLRDDSGKVIGAVAVFKDLSENRQLQKQVMRADRLAALGELVAGIAHDIRNPLTSIRGFMQYLQKSSDPKEWREFSPLIIREVDGLNRIVGELLEFAKPYPPRISQVRINDLIQEMLLFVNKGTDEHKVCITLKLDDTIPPIEADGEQLKQVLLNLLINASQAMPDGGTIMIETCRNDNDSVKFLVTDSGMGVALENREKIFDPFFSTKPSGTGLGLAVVQRIINAHHGEIAISSEVGEGTSVAVVLPICHETVKEA